jgi:hypothetical protein
MRYQSLASLALAVSFLLPAVAAGQLRGKVSIDDVRIGFSTAPEVGEPVDVKNRLSYFKSGAWTPVYVDLTAGPEGLDKARLIIEVTDSDDIQSNYIVPLPRLDPREQFTAIGYVKSGSAGGDLVATVEVGSQRSSLKKSFQEYQSFSLEEVLYLTVGSRLAGLRRTVLAINEEAEQPQGPQQWRSFYRPRAAFIDDVELLPTRWFGYSSVDLLILTTGNLDFVTKLLNDQKNRKQALAEWVRRGGRLLISMGRHQDVANKLLEQMQISLPVHVTGIRPVSRLEDVEAWLREQLQKPLALQNRPTKDNKVPPIDVAQLETTAKDLDVLIWLGKQEQPLILRAPHGRGQVMLVAFDLDQPPFSGWASQSFFWQKLLKQAHFLTQDKGRDNPQQPGLVVRGGPGMSYDESSNELAANLQRGLEHFGDVPVISFGWVALFILVYIIIVGPLDYLFLKKVVKRLELTWITFPTVVLVVSAVAYFAAYALKGNDLKINKIDLVDIDLANQKAYGDTWFTLFSPRIQLYTVGIEPVAPVWAQEMEEEKKTSGVMVSWLGRPGSGFGDFGRPRSQSLFRRAYDYAADASGLQGVPIQVWSSKSFTASWERPLDPGKLPFSAELRHPADTGNPTGNPQKIEGWIINQLPVALKDAWLIYGDGTPKPQVYALGTLRPNEKKNLHISAQDKEKRSDLDQWVPSGIQRSLPTGNSQAPGQVNAGGAASTLKKALFFDAGQNQPIRNNTIRHLDQSWRLVRHQGEAMLFGYFDFDYGAAEKVNQGPATPTRLWLGQLPGSGQKYEPLAGTLQQETYIRVFIPVTQP